MNQASSTAHLIESDSPALAGLLRRTVANDYSLLAVIYQLAAGNCSSDQPEIRREPGVSFNPRSARICQIAISDGQLRAPTEIAAVMLSCCAIGSLSGEILQILPPDFSQALETAQAVHELLGLQLLDPSNVVITIAQSHLLDAARHLHMRTTDLATNEAAYATLVTAAEVINSRYKNSLLSRKIELSLSRALPLIRLDPQRGHLNVQ